MRISLEIKRSTSGPSILELLRAHGTGEEIFDMPFGRLTNETLRVCPKNGDAPIATKGRHAGTIILIPDVSIPVTTGDAIERTLPSGIVERFLVTDPGFHEGTGHGIPSHYQVKFRRADAIGDRTALPAIHISGHNARVNVGSTDSSTNVVHLAASGESSDLAAELKILRLELLARTGGEPEQYSTIGAVATAESAANRGEEVKDGVVRFFGSAGKWALSTATDLGLKIAMEYVKVHLG